MIKQSLSIFLLLPAFFFAQNFVTPHYTLSLSLAPQCIIDSTLVKPNGAINESIRYTYNAKRLLLKKDRQNTSTNQREINFYTYDANDSVTTRGYATGTGAPTSSTVIRITRNQAAQVVADTVLYGSGLPLTLNLSTEYVYDMAGYPSQITKRSFSGVWTNLNRVQFTRNAAGLVIVRLFEGWINNAWQNSSQTLNTYNANGDLTESIWQNWNNSNSSWTNTSRTRNVYTGTHVYTSVTYSWSGAWLAQSRYVYSPASAIDSVTIEWWNPPQWEGSDRYVRTWSQGRLTSVVEKKFNSSSWQPAWKHEYSYDNDGNHIATNLYAANAPAPWFLLTAISHYYNCNALALSQASVAKPKVYPVPSAGIVFFESAISVKGGSVLSPAGVRELTFKGSTADLSALSAGIYLVELALEDGTTAVVKTIKE